MNTVDCYIVMGSLVSITDSNEDINYPIGVFTNYMLGCNLCDELTEEWENIKKGKNINEALKPFFMSYEEIKNTGGSYSFYTEKLPLQIENKKCIFDVNGLTKTLKICCDKMYTLIINKDVAVPKTIFDKLIFKHLLSEICIIDYCPYCGAEIVIK